MFCKIVRFPFNKGKKSWVKSVAHSIGITLVVQSYYVLFPTFFTAIQKMKRTTKLGRNP